MSGNDLHRPIRVLRVSRAAFIMAAVLGVVFANILAVYSLAAAFAMAVPIAILLTFAAVQTSTIRQWRAEARELNRPRMTPEDYRRLREMEIELGWEPSEPPAPVERSSREAATPVTPVPPRYCTCAEPSLVEVCVPESETSVASYCAACGRATGTLTATGSVTLSGTAALSGPGTLSAPMTGPGGRWRPLSELSDPGAVAAEHFAALARAGRERCIGFCPICAERDRHREARTGQARLPAALREATIAAMEPGHPYYAVPWAMQADEGGRMWLRPGYTVWKRPGGTAQMRIELREDGYHVWPVRLHGYTPEPHGAQQFVPVAVLEGER